MNKSKRNLVKTLGVASVGLASWKKPVVDSISLPAHAQTTGCTLPAGCYEIESDGFSFITWDGGVGPHSVPFHELPGCNGLAFVTEERFVLAPDLESALELLPECQEPPMIDVVLADLPSGCRLWSCEDVIEN